MTKLFVCGLLLWAVPARAQSVEVAGLFGYTTAAEIDQKAENVDDLAISGGFSWAIAGTYFLTEHFGVEGWFSQQPTHLRLETADAGAGLFDLTASQVLATMVFQPLERSATLQPFVSVGVGTTIFTASDFDSESKVAWTVGGGLKWLLSPAIGARFNARFLGTALNDAASAVCDPFGFCQDALSQMEVAAGLVFRF